MRQVLLCITLVLVTPLLLAFAPRLEAQAKNCVPDSGCPAGGSPSSKPPCCKPPPCEFTQALKFAKANLINIQNNIFVYGENPDITEADWAETNFNDYMSLLGKSSPCPVDPDWPDLEQPPRLWVDQQCEIMLAEDYKQEYRTDLDALLAGSNSCKELVEAESDRAEARRQICLAERYSSKPRTVRERMLQDEAEAQTKVDELEAQQRRYEQVCTVAPDSKDAQQGAEDILAPLVQQADEDELAPLVPAKPPKAKKKKAKRSGKKAGRR